MVRHKPQPVAGPAERPVHPGRARPGRRRAVHPARGAGQPAGPAGHQLLDARVHADAPAGTAGLRPAPGHGWPPTPASELLLVVDEAHLYRGAAGAEVGLLLRRLRARLGIPADRLQVICASASFTDPEYARVFAAQLTGKAPDDFRTVYGELAVRRRRRRRDQQTTPRALAAVPLAEFYEANDDQARLDAVRGFLDYRQAGQNAGRPGRGAASKRCRTSRR